MMDKYYYFVVTEEENGKLRSFVLRVHSSNNLVGKFDHYQSANICNTKKEANALADYWNACYKKNGTYMCD
jgi:hypothetical protein